MFKSNIEKTLILIFLIFIVTFIIFNSIYIYKDLINSSKSLIYNEINNLSRSTENEFSRFINDANFFVHSGKLTEASMNKFISDISQEDIRMHLLNYKNIVFKIHILDNYSRRTIELSGINYLDISSFDAITAKELYEISKIFYEDNKVFYVIPTKEDGKVQSNIIYEIDVNKFLENASLRYYFGKKMWTWYLDKYDNVICLSYSDGNKNSYEFSVEDIEFVKAQSKEGLMGIYENSINFGEDIKTITVFNPLNLLDLKVVIGFSLDKGDILSKLNYRIQGVFFAVIMIIVIIMTIFMNFIYQIVDSERKLSESKKNMLLIINSMPIGILLHDGNGIIKDVNKFALNMMEIKNKKDVLDKNVSNYIYCNEKKKCEENLRRIDKSEYRLLKQSNEYIPIVINDIEINYYGENLIMDIFVDVSHIEKLREIAENANKSKSEFIANISHEIRTPMNGIVTSIDILGQTDLNFEQKEFLKIIRESSKNLLTIINDILDTSKIEFGKITLEKIKFSFRELIESIYNQFVFNVDGKEILVISDIKSHIPDNLIGDPNRIRQIIVNLLSNAIKFTEKGKILVSFDIDELNDSKLLLHVFIADTGIGIAKDQLSNIFDSFVQEDQSITRKYGGTGLGTTIAKNLVELMDGNIWVESPNMLFHSKAPGSVFHFTIELHIENFENRFEGLELEDGSCLVIDYDQENIEVSKRILKDFGLITSFKSEYESGFKVISENVFRDFQFETVLINGVGFEDYVVNEIKKIRELGNNQPKNIIVTFLNIDEELLKMCKILNVDFMSMPFRQGEMYKILKRKYSKKTTEELSSSLKRLLLVEDNDINIKVAGKIFEKFNIAMDYVKNGKLALEILEEREYDIIFMDIQMPIMNGIEASKKIREMGILTPIVAMSANEGNTHYNLYKNAGMNDFVEKPIEMQVIERILSKYL